jgi:hypothetical protein
VRRRQPVSTGFDDERGPEGGGWLAFPKLGKSGKQTLPGVVRKEHSPADTLISQSNLTCRVAGPICVASSHKTCDNLFQQHYRTNFKPH